jgi:hypothetical protein
MLFSLLIEGMDAIVEYAQASINHDTLQFTPTQSMHSNS